MNSKVAIAEAFISRLGDPTKFDYTGEVNDLGKPTGSCVCGHAIQYEYIISDGKRRASVGSECINHFKEYNPKLYEELMQAHEARIQKMEKKNKKAREAKEVKELVRQYNEKYERIRDLFAPYPELPFLPKDLFYSFRYYVQENPKEYKRTSSYIKWYKEHLNGFDDFVAEVEEWVSENPPPEPLLATEKQVKYLKSLIKKIGGDHPEYSKLTRDEASNMISELKWG